MASIQDLASSIAQFEGFNTPGSLAATNNNPGNLRSWGSNPVVNGFASFPTADAGWAALESQIGQNINRGLTLNEFFAGKPGVYAGYAPAADSNQPAGYAATVASWIGISPDVPLADALDGTAVAGSAAAVDAGVASASGEGPAWGILAAAVGGAALLWLLLR
jgi:hypothetical protein